MPEQEPLRDQDVVRYLFAADCGKFEILNLSTMMYDF